MRALKYKKTQLNRVIEDERLLPNRRLLALILMMYFDAEVGEEKELVLFLLRNQFLTPRGMRMYDDEDEAVKTENRALEYEAKNVLEQYLLKLASKEKDVPGFRLKRLRNSHRYGRIMDWVPLQEEHLQFGTHSASVTLTSFIRMCNANAQARKQEAEPKPVVLG